VTVLEDLPEFESRLVDETSRDVDHCLMRDVECLDQLIGQYFSIAENADKDFDRALRAAHVMLALIDIQITLLESHAGGAP
jgi:hypothetical protein